MMMTSEKAVHTLMWRCHSWACRQRQQWSEWSRSQISSRPPLSQGRTA